MSETNSDDPIIKARRLSLEAWLERILIGTTENDPILDIAFPSDEHREEYIKTIEKRSEEDVRRLIYEFLIKSGTLGPIDEIRFGGLIELGQRDPDAFKRSLHTQYHQRLIRYYGYKNNNILPWEGNTWILDLLPHYPRQAIQALNAYIYAHVQTLPDWRLYGQYDALELIRAKYIGLPGTQTEKVKFLVEVMPREFECLVERLYHYMGYQTQLTPRTRDGGRDIVATRTTEGMQEHLLIECKRYSSAIDVKTVRALLGVISDEKVNKGVVATSSRFTRGAEKFAKRNPRLELIGGEKAVRLMNEYLGTTWPTKTRRLVIESEKASCPSDTSG